MLTRTCDRCGTDIPPGYGWYSITNTKEPVRTDIAFRELCGPCQSAFNYFLANKPVPPREAPK